MRRRRDRRDVSPGVGLSPDTSKYHYLIAYRDSSDTDDDNDTLRRSIHCRHQRIDRWQRLAEQLATELWIIPPSEWRLWLWSSSKASP